MENTWFVGAVTQMEIFYKHIYVRMMQLNCMLRDDT